MTISRTQATVRKFTSGGPTFNVDSLPRFTNDDLVVSVYLSTGTSAGKTVVLTERTDYTLDNVFPSTGTAVVSLLSINISIDGTAAITSGVLQANAVLQVAFNPNPLQSAALREGSRTTPLAIEKSLDRNTMAIKSINRELDRAIKLGPQFDDEVTGQVEGEFSTTGESVVVLNTEDEENKKLVLVHRDEFRGDVGEHASREVALYNIVDTGSTPTTFDTIKSDITVSYDLNAPNDIAFPTIPPVPIGVWRSDLARYLAEEDASRDVKPGTTTRYTLQESVNDGLKVVWVVKNTVHLDQAGRDAPITARIDNNVWSGPLKFSQGPRGLAGMDGAPGRDGTDGRDGADGSPGRDGMDGSPGRDGADADPAVTNALSGRITINADNITSLEGSRTTLRTELTALTSDVIGDASGDSTGTGTIYQRIASARSSGGGGNAVTNFLHTIRLYRKFSDTEGTGNFARAVSAVTTALGRGRGSTNTPISSATYNHDTDALSVVTTSSASSFTVMSAADISAELSRTRGSDIEPLMYIDVLVEFSNHPSQPNTFIGTAVRWDTVPFRHSGSLFNNITRTGEQLNEVAQTAGTKIDSVQANTIAAGVVNTHNTDSSGTAHSGIRSLISANSGRITTLENAPSGGGGGGASAPLNVLEVNDGVTVFDSIDTVPDTINVVVQSDVDFHRPLRIRPQGSSSSSNITVGTSSSDGISSGIPVTISFPVTATQRTDIENAAQSNRGTVYFEITGSRSGSGSVESRTVETLANFTIQVGRTLEQKFGTNNLTDILTRGLPLFMQNMFTTILSRMEQRHTRVLLLGDDTAEGSGVRLDSSRAVTFSEEAHNNWINADGVTMGFGSAANTNFGSDREVHIPGYLINPDGSVGNSENSRVTIPTRNGSTAFAYVPSSRRLFVSTEGSENSSNYAFILFAVAHISSYSFVNPTRRSVFRTTTAHNGFSYSLSIFNSEITSLVEFDVLTTLAGYAQIAITAIGGTDIEDTLELVYTRAPRGQGGANRYTFFRSRVNGTFNLTASITVTTGTNRDSYTLALIVADSLGNVKGSSRSTLVGGDSSATAIDSTVNISGGDYIFLVENPGFSYNFTHLNFTVQGVLLNIPGLTPP